MHPRCLPGALAVCLALLAATAAHAQNLLVNPDFDSDLAGWTVSATGTATSGPFATAGSPAPGCADLLAINLGQFAQASLGQCVAIAAPANVELFARYQSVAGEATERRVRATFHDQPACAGTALETVEHATLGSLPDGWSALARLDHPLPAGTLSAWIAIDQDAQALAEQNHGRFDHVRFGLAGTTPVELQGLTIE